MTNSYSPIAREPLPCPACEQHHPEDRETCPNTGQVILLDRKYRLKKLLGEGSFGLVWDARNIDTHKEVAIKTLRAEVVSNPAVLGRFLWEATAAGRVHNPHVCDVLDLVKNGAHGPYIVLERLHGRSLAALLDEQGRLSPEEAVRVIRQALVGLAAVHRAGIVHRDIKPENIFLHEPAPGSVIVKLLDFGISKFSATAGDRARTAADLFMGTPEYASPEQARGAAQVDPRSDIWAIGAILYRSLSGGPPFTGPDIPSLLTAILHAPHPSLTAVAPDVPAGLAAIVDRCLGKDRELRYPSCAELSAALEPFEGLSFARTLLDTRNPRAAGDADANARERTLFADGFSGPSGHVHEDMTFSLDSDGLRLFGEASGASIRVSTAVDAPVLLSCSAADRRWLEHLRQHLGAHRDGRRLATLDCGEFTSDVRRHDAYEDAFGRARAVVLLVSAQFLAVDFAPGSELYSFVLMAQERGLPVLWFVIGECTYEGTDLFDFKALGEPSRPLDRLPFTEADQALEQICDQLVTALGVPQAPAPTSDVTRAGKAPFTDERPDSTLELQRRLESARARKTRLETLGEDTREVHDEINKLRRALRVGRPLGRGDILDDRFVVLDQLGAGGFAAVWSAIDQTTGASVALKILHSQHAHNAERRERFFRGARIMAQLAHPNIVKIFEPSASDGEYEYFAMQYVSGGTLRDAVLGGRLSIVERIRVLLAVADALAFAHERGIIHRDIKPSNILVADDGTPYLSDFDLVRAEDTTGGTAGGLGTVIYAAPEMMERASEADARADVYGLGMTLAFLFYERDLTMEVIRNTDRLINELKVSEGIRMVIRTAITWNRDHRFRSAAEFRAALSAAVARRDSLPLTTKMPSHAATVSAAPAAAEPGDAHVEAPQGAEGNVSLIKAFAAIAKESEVLRDHAVSEVFASLEVHEESPRAAAEPPREATLAPLPEHDRTLPETRRLAPTPLAVAAIAAGAGVLLVLLYLLLVP